MQKSVRRGASYVQKANNSSAIVPIVQKNNKKQQKVIKKKHFLSKNFMFLEKNFYSSDYNMRLTMKFEKNLEIEVVKFPPLNQRVCGWSLPRGYFLKINFIFGIKIYPF